MATEVDKAGGKDAAATNPRGIPYAPFVDKVEDYVTTRADVEGALKNFQEMISKYQFMENNTTKRLSGLQSKIPDIEKTLETVEFLQTRNTPSSPFPSPSSSGDELEPLDAHFELNDTLYAKAHIQQTKEVYLWLGANVMLSYELQEARELLSEKLGAARTSLANCREDLDFLREQITTMEVATARVYNWDVGQRRKEKAEGKGGEEDEDDKAPAKA
ncbi:hypothetical protein MBLNU230_g1270t1 [Neophaeotheca triangularis]